MRGRVQETGIKLRTSCSDTIKLLILQKLKLLVDVGFNYLTT